MRSAEIIPLKRQKTRAPTSQKLSFTSAQLRKLTADPATPATLIDSKQPGLILRRAASGRWDFRFERRIEGELFRKTLEVWVEIADLDRLRREVMELTLIATRGDWVRGGGPAVTALNTATWEEALATHIEAAAIRPKSQHLYRVAVAAFSRHLPKAVSALDGPGFRVAFNRVTAGTEGKPATLSVATASTYARALASIWSSWAWQFEEKRRPQINPIRSGMQTGPRRSAWVTAPARTGRLRANQTSDWLKAAAERQAELGPRMGVAFAAIQFATLTGLRSQEVFRLRFDEVEGDWLSLSADRMKGKRAFRRPLGSRAAAIITAQADLHGGEGYVFPSWQKAETPLSTVGSALAELNAAQGTVIRMHDLRRTYVSAAREVGCEVGLVKRLIAHSLEADVTERHYSTGLEDLLTATAQQIEDALGGGSVDE